jgi:hypothetical protein
LSLHVNHRTFLCEIIFVNTIYTTTGNIYDFVWNKSVTISFHQYYSVCFSTGSGVRCAFLLTTNAIVYIPEIAALPKLRVNDIFNEQQALICTMKKHIIILLDANEQLGTSAQGLIYLIRECKLVELFHQHRMVSVRHFQRMQMAIDD